MSNTTISTKDKADIDHLIIQSAASNTSLIFSDKYLGDSTGSYIFTSLNSHVTSNPQTSPPSVECKGCYLGSESGASLAELLRNPACGIKELSLEWNSLGSFEECICDIAEALSINTSLTQLDLRNNNLSQSSGAVIARALRDNKSLVTLDLRWNEIGNNGGMAFKELLLNDTNTSLKTIKLQGNKLTDQILNDVDQLLRHKTLPNSVSSLANLSTKDELHLTKSRVDELIKDVTRKEAEITALKNNQKNDELNNVALKNKAKSEMENKIELLEQQLHDSASNLAGLEVEVLRETNRADRIQATLIQEQRQKDHAQTALRVSTETHTSKKITQDRELSQVKTSLKLTENTLSELREEVDEMRVEFGEREKELLTQITGSDRKLNESRRSEDKVKTEHLRIEVIANDAEERAKLSEDRADVAEKMLDDAISDRTTRIEELRKSSTLQLDKVREDTNTRLRLSDQRVLDAESKFEESDLQRRESESAASSAAIITEQKLSDLASKLKLEHANNLDSMVSELKSSLDLVTSQRVGLEIELDNVKKDLQNLRDVRGKELMSSKQTVDKLNKALNESMAESRNERSKATELKLETTGLKRQLDPYKRKCDSYEIELKTAEENRVVESQRLEGLLSNERLDRSKERDESYKRLTVLSEAVKASRINIEEQRLGHVKELGRLEKGMIACVSAVFQERVGKGSGSGNGKGGSKVKKDKENIENNENVENVEGEGVREVEV